VPAYGATAWLIGGRGTLLGYGRRGRSAGPEYETRSPHAALAHVLAARAGMTMDDTEVVFAFGRPVLKQWWRAGGWTDEIDPERLFRALHAGLSVRVQMGAKGDWSREGCGRTMDGLAGER
jgi:hypothetical protein